MSHNKSTKIYFGWWIVLACFLITVYIAGTISLGFTALITPLVNQFGWSYTFISLAVSVQCMLIGVSAPCIGALIDKWGPRRLVITGTLLSFIGMLLLSRVSSLVTFYIAFTILSLGMSACNMSSMIPAVINWFHKRLTLATGIIVSGAAIGGFMVPLTTILIDKFGWQYALTILGIGMLIIPLPLSFLLRYKPADYGNTPYGIYETVSETKSRSESLPNSTSVKQALQNKVFWMIVIGLILQFMVINSVLTHIMPYLNSYEFSRMNSSLAASFIAVISIVGRLGIGWLGNKIIIKRLMLLVFILGTLGIICFGIASTKTLWIIIPAMIFLGIGWGGQAAGMASLISQYFGKTRFATIFGFVIGFMQIGGIIGPPIAGWAFDTWRTYQFIWLAYSVLAIISTILIAFLPNPSIISNNHTLVHDHNEGD